MQITIVNDSDNRQIMIMRLTLTRTSWTTRKASARSLVLCSFKPVGYDTIFRVGGGGIEIGKDFCFILNAEYVVALFILFPFMCQAKKYGRKVSVCVNMVQL